LQQTGSGDAPGAPQEREAASASTAVRVGTRPRVSAHSQVGLAAQPKPNPALIEAPDEDRWLGIKVLTYEAIEAKVRAVINRPGWMVRDGRTDFNESPARARAHLYHSHFR